jgi:hypothetical protein
MASPRGLADCRVTDLSGGAVRLGDEWRERPAVVVWLRHYGCLLCREQAAGFRRREAEIEALGARLVFVGNGDAAAALAFAARHCPGCRVLSDPGLQSYGVIGARRGWASTLGPAAVGAGWRAFRHGFRQGRVRGVPDQQGGVYVVLPGDRVVYAYLSGSAGDHPPIEDVIGALRASGAGETVPASTGGAPARAGHGDGSR